MLYSQQQLLHAFYLLTKQYNTPTTIIYSTTISILSNKIIAMLYNIDNINNNSVYYLQ